MHVGKSKYQHRGNVPETAQGIKLKLSGYTEKDFEKKKSRYVHIATYATTATKTITAIEAKGKTFRQR